MKVIAHRINEPKHNGLHWDFMKETCKSFNVPLEDKAQIILPKVSQKVVCLRHDRGACLNEYDFAYISSILVGCDDSGDDNWMDGYDSVRIHTPSNYFLWSGVALGITLYHIHNSTNILKLQH